MTYRGKGPGGRLKLWRKCVTCPGRCTWQMETEHWLCPDCGGQWNKLNGVRYISPIEKLARDAKLAEDRKERGEWLRQRERLMDAVAPDRLKNPADIKALKAVIETEFAPLVNILAAFSIPSRFDDAVSVVEELIEKLRQAGKSESDYPEEAQTLRLRMLELSMLVSSNEDQSEQGE